MHTSRSLLVLKQRRPQIFTIPYSRTLASLKTSHPFSENLLVKRMVVALTHFVRRINVQGLERIQDNGAKSCD